MCGHILCDGGIMIVTLSLDECNTWFLWNKSNYIWTLSARLRIRVVLWYLDIGGGGWM